MSDLLMSCKEAVKRFVKDGCTVAIGGFVLNRKPYALVHEIIRQKKADLYIEASGAGGETDLLIGAGCVKTIVNAYTANAAFGKISRKFRESIEKSKIRFEDYSLDVQPLRFHAAALGLPFVPIRHLLRGSDLENKWGIKPEEYLSDPKLPDAKMIIGENPFDRKEQIVYYPVPKVDVALIHAQKAAIDGTVRLEGPLFIDYDIALAAKHVIISFEELVEQDELRKDPWCNQIPNLIPDALVNLPYGAHPSQCAYYYDYDPKYMYLYDKCCLNDGLYKDFLNEYILTVDDHREYIDKIGLQRLDGLKVGRKNYVENLSRRDS